MTTVGAKSSVLAGQTITHLFGGAVMPQPTQWWIALYSSDPTIAVTASVPTPVTALIQVTAWTISGNQASNTNAIQASSVPAGQTWTISNFAIFDSNLSTGRPLYVGQFRLTKTLQESDVYIIAPGQLVLKET